MEIKLSKIPETPDEREKLIEEIIKDEEEILAKNIGYIQRSIIERLINLGYKLSDLEIKKGYEVVLSDREKFTTSVDILITIEGKSLLAIKCTPASLDSWERFMFAFCRVVEPYQIPFAFITDGKEGRLINILSGKVEETMEIPSKEDFIQALLSMKFIPYYEDRIPKEKRILYAYDAIKCCPTSSV
ncbi:MAG: hypothetical protein RMI30_00910 [Thermodesulfovibrio sp.]|nr:hypothetical protein [Thermodesulfovibrio sp.]MDW7998003.1 hypothetical protein [Thermodesulfovibrio sp.]